MTDEEINNIFTYHKPQTSQLTRYEKIREDARMFAHTINNLCPGSREKSLAITSLQQVVMWANASIAIHEQEFEPSNPHPPPLDHY